MIRDFQVHAPEGSLKHQNKDGKTYFYQQYVDKNTQTWEQRYIKRKDIALAKNLAQKQYYTLLLPTLENNMKALNHLIKRYHPEEEHIIYDELCNERKRLISPLPNSIEEQIRKWHEEKYEKYNSYSENLKYETEQGDLVRSKSEVIIANILYLHQKDILYKYERPLEVVVGKNTKTIYPDFTILNIHTGRIVYWEHAGRMDDPNYVDDFVKKTNIYIANNLFPGKNVYFSYESPETLLDISIIKKLIKEIL